MFGKLLKYEFKSVGTWYLALYGIVAAASVVLGLWIQTIIRRSEHQVDTFADNAPWNLEGALFVFVCIAFGILISALLISTFFLVVTRFQKSVYGRQGYLTMTLPITSHQLILSKLLTSIIWYLLAGLMVVISLIIIWVIAFIPVYHKIDILNMLHELSNIANWPVIYFVISYFTEMVMGILLAYFAISLGQLFRDHRTLLAIVFYFAIQFVLGIISFIYTFSLITAGYSELSIFPFYPSTIGIIFNILLAVAFYFGTHFIMTKKLNLQ